MAKQKVNPVVIALIVAVIVLAAITTKYLVDAYTPSSVDKSMDELNKKLEEVKKNPK